MLPFNVFMISPHILDLSIDFSLILLQPKSPNLISPLTPNNIFAPLISLCIILFSCKYYMADKIYLE